MGSAVRAVGRRVPRMITPEMLLAAPGIENYPDLFPRLQPRHPSFLGDPTRTAAAALATALTAAGRSGPATPSEAAERYRRAGELDSLLAVAPEQVTPA